MTATYIVTTTGTVSPVEIPELKLSLVHPTTTDLINKFEPSQINSATSIQDSIDSGALTLSINSMATDFANMLSNSTNETKSGTISIPCAGALTVAQYLKVDGIPTDTTPIVFAYRTKIQAMSFSNSVNSSDVDLRIYVNAVLELTWSIRNKRTAYKGLTVPNQIIVARDDYISIEAVPVTAGTDPSDIIFLVQYFFTNSKNGTGGNATI